MFNSFLVCLNKAKTIQNIIQNRFLEQYSEISDNSPLMSSMKKIAEKNEENELKNVEMEVDMKK